MRRLLSALTIICSGCAANVYGPEPSEVTMTAAGLGDECIFTLQGERFVTKGLENPALMKGLSSHRAEVMVLRAGAGVPYRCFGLAIILLQITKSKFRIPGLDPYGRIHSERSP